MILAESEPPLGLLPSYESSHCTVGREFRIAFDGIRRWLVHHRVPAPD